MQTGCPSGTARLRLLEGGENVAVDSYTPAGFELRVQPMRPGMAHERLNLVLDPERARAVAGAAEADGVPVELWAGITIESERALRATSQDFGVDRKELEALLATAAKEHVPIVLAHGRRLAAYSRALRRQSLGAASGMQVTMTALVPYHSLVAWETQAGRAGERLEVWASGLLDAIPSGRVIWEATAAQRGQTLGEWIVVQAARRASS